MTQTKNTYNYPRRAAATSRCGRTWEEATGNPHASCYREHFQQQVQHPSLLTLVLTLYLLSGFIGLLIYLLLTFITN